MCRVWVWSIFGPFLFWAVEKSFVIASSTRETAVKQCKAKVCVGLSVKVLSSAHQSKKGRDLGSSGSSRKTQAWPWMVWWPASSGFPCTWVRKVGVQLWRGLKISRFVAFTAVDWQARAADWFLIFIFFLLVLSSISYTYVCVHIHMYACKKAKPKEHKCTNSCNK